jgi:ABC-type uncharacterized transport system involved in gliding motility auxiliary subunit
MPSQWLKARQTKYAAYVTTYILVIVAIVAVANMFGDRYNKSYDATANKRYSLSEQTAKIVKGIKQDATITYFQQSKDFRQGKDLLDEYANLSTKVHVRYVDMDKNPEETRAAGVKNYGIAVVQIGLKKEEAKSMTEEGITGAFIRDLKNNTRTVCFVAGSGEHRIDDSDREGLSRFKDLLAKDEYEAKSIDLLRNSDVPTECTALVVAGPTRNYEQPEVDSIKKYVENGGRAFFMLDPPLKMGHDEIADNDALATVLQSWGVTLDKDLVVDRLGQLVGLGAQVALVGEYSYQPIVNEMKGETTGFPLSRSMEIKNSDKTTVEKLFDSSGSSFATVNLNSPAVDPRDPKNKKGPLTLAAAGTYKTDKEGSQGRFVVIGDSTWAANQFINFNGNNDLALNAVNWLASDEDLISIRPKPPEDRRITMSKKQMNVVQATSLIILPLVVVFAGVGVWWKRR